jgi:hypothetical protein
MNRKKLPSVVFILISTFITTAYAGNPTPQVIKLDIPTLDVEDSAGGIIAADVNNDKKPDYLVTVRGHLAVYDNGGEKLWLKKTDIVVGGQSESEGLPGHHGPGTAAADVDNDGKIEVIYLTKDSVLHIVDGATGRQESSAKPPVPDGAAGWEVAMIADFRGTGKDNDILLQATNKSGYRMGKYLAAYEIDTLLKGGEPLWTTDQFVSCAHNGARLADLDGDGKDEVLGVTIFSPDGKLITRAIEDRYHADSVFVADVRPELPGLEMVMLEEGADQVQVIALTGPVWRNHFKKQEPQNAAIGKFKENSDEVFIWCRSRYSEHQKPFVFDSKGNKIFDYEMDNIAPEGWTASGVEVIHTIDWTGRKQQLACAKERHTSGDVCLFEPLTGKFVLRLKEKADRLYVADTRGDWREEIIVLNSPELHIYTNKAPNPHPNQKRLWTNRNYCRLKQCYNYYSP